MNKKTDEKNQRGQAPLITDPWPTSSITKGDKEEKKVTVDMQQLTGWGVNILSKCYLPNSQGLRQTLWQNFISIYLGE